MKLANIFFMGCSLCIMNCHAFEYKDVYLPEGTDSIVARQLNLNRVEHDWAIWGHNLYRVLGDDIPENTFALIGGERNDEQLCFSSQYLYNSICHYIDDNFSRRDSSRFVIMPYDNSLSCQCPVCKARGNTSRNATPAVTALIRRLCKAYPNHMFFTSYYMSTAFLPEKELPENAGVLISAIDWPMRSVHSGKEDKFKEVIESWSGLTKHVYVWDYINNFDDYATPFPCFNAMTDRMRYYQKVGVDGVFLNGSGTDKSLFSDLKTHVLASLLNNPQTDWKDSAREFLDKNYPKSSIAIYDYIVDMENAYQDRERAIQIYAGVKTAIREYLDVDRFKRFYDDISRLSKNTSGTEKVKLEEMLVMLSLTRMEIARIECTPQLFATDVTDDWLLSESGWRWKDYVSDYKSMLDRFGKTDNMKIKLSSTSLLDEDYSDLRPLTDGVDALTSNYHCGWVLFTLGNIDLKVENLSESTWNGLDKQVCIQMLSSERYHFSLPRLVEVYSGEKLISSAEPKNEFVTLPLGKDVSVDRLRIKVYPDGKKKMALGEVSINKLQ